MEHKKVNHSPSSKTSEEVFEDHSLLRIKVVQKEFHRLWCTATGTKKNGKK